MQSYSPICVGLVGWGEHTRQHEPNARCCPGYLPVSVAYGTVSQGRREVLLLAMRAGGSALSKWPVQSIGVDDGRHLTEMHDGIQRSAKAGKEISL